MSEETTRDTTVDRLVDLMFGGAAEESGDTTNPQHVTEPATPATRSCL
jgi:hypothetical protein